jgi:hypothetical protein
MPLWPTNLLLSPRPSGTKLPRELRTALTGANVPSTSDLLVDPQISLPSDNLRVDLLSRGRH